MLTSKQAFQHAAAIERLEGGKKCFMNLKRSILGFLSSKDLVTMERLEKQKKRFVLTITNKDFHQT